MSVWFFLDTHVPRRCRVGWLDTRGQVSVGTLRGRPATVIRRLFTVERARFMSCQGICVVPGPGSFSAIRLGVLYANLLARLLRVPLVSASLDETADLARLAGTLERRPALGYVAPSYDAEPNITLPRL